MWGKLHREFSSNICVLGKANNNQHPRYLSRRKAASSQEVHLEQMLEGIPENWKLRCFPCKVDQSWPWGRVEVGLEILGDYTETAESKSHEFQLSWNKGKTPHFEMKWDCQHEALALLRYNPHVEMRIRIGPQFRHGVQHGVVFLGARWQPGHQNRNMKYRRAGSWYDWVWGTCAGSFLPKHPDEGQLWSKLYDAS